MRYNVFNWSCYHLIKVHASGMLDIILLFPENLAHTNIVTRYKSSSLSWNFGMKMDIAKIITRWDRKQLLKSCYKVRQKSITKWVRYYNVWQTVITKCIMYYKVWQVVTTKCVKYYKVTRDIVTSFLFIQFNGWSRDTYGMCCIRFIFSKKIFQYSNNALSPWGS